MGTFIIFSYSEPIARQVGQWDRGPGPIPPFRAQRIIGKGIKQGRSRHHDFMNQGVSMGKRPEFRGGGGIGAERGRIGETCENGRGRSICQGR